MRPVARRSRYAVAGLWAAVILVGSLVSGAGGTLPPTGPLGVVGPDKWIHAAEYGLLAGLVAWATTPRTRGESVRILLAVAGYGVVVELLQAPLVTRTASPRDALANLVGAAVALVLWWRLVGARDADSEDADGGTDG